MNERRDDLCGFVLGWWYHENIDNFFDGYRVDRERLFDGETITDVRYYAELIERCRVLNDCTRDDALEMVVNAVVTGTGDEHMADAFDMAALRAALPILAAEYGWPKPNVAEWDYYRQKHQAAVAAATRL